MPSLKSIQLDFFGTPEESNLAPGATLIEVDSISLEESEEARTDLYRQLNSHLEKGDSLQLLVSGDAPVGLLHFITVVASGITETRVLVKQNAVGNIPASVFVFTDLKGEMGLPNAYAN
jgi:hypothetical protein